VLEKETLERAREDEREGKAPSTQAGEFLRQEMSMLARVNTPRGPRKQAIAIGLSKARSASVKLPPKTGSKRTRKQAPRDLGRGRTGKRKTSAKRSRATVAGAEARRAQHGIKARIVSSGEDSRPQTFRSVTIAHRKEGDQDKKGSNGRRRRGGYSFRFCAAIQ
jgi:Family of unknown function (DUF6496)